MASKDDSATSPELLREAPPRHGPSPLNPSPQLLHLNHDEVNFNSGLGDNDKSAEVTMGDQDDAIRGILTSTVLDTSASMTSGHNPRSFSSILVDSTLPSDLSISQLNLPVTGNGSSGSGNGSNFSLMANTSALGFNSTEVGSPGHTPFPHFVRSEAKWISNCSEVAKVGNDQAFSFSPDKVIVPDNLARPGTSNANVSADSEVELLASPPPVPFNSPDCSHLDEILLAGAKKQEEAMKKLLEEKDLPGLMVAAGGTPTLPKVARQRKRICSDEQGQGQGQRCNQGDLEQLRRLEELKTRAKASLVDDGEAMTAKDRSNKHRARANEAIELLKDIVPGLEKGSEKLEVFERTLKYTMFLRARMGADHDEAFLNEYMGNN